MTIDVSSIYVATVLVLMSTPGPSQLLMLSNSIKNGLRRSLFTALGDLTANFLQMLAAGLGLAVLIASSFYALKIIKWLGVAYLNLAWLADGSKSRCRQCCGRSSRDSNAATESLAAGVH